MLHLYSDLAPWYRLVTPPEDYAEEAVLYREVLESATPRRLETLLELGCGAGHVASYLRARFRCTLTDLSPEMLALSRALNPSCEHAAGDMRTLRLGRTFDAVFAHDALAYLTSEDDLRRTFETAAAHLGPGGVLLLVPDFVGETFAPGTSHGGVDGPDGRAARYLEWTWDPDPADTTIVADYTFVLREPDGRARAVHDRHVEGLFPRATWHRLLEQAGFRVLPAPDPNGVEAGELVLAMRT